MKLTRKYQSGGGFGIYTPLLVGSPSAAQVAPTSGATPALEQTQGSIISEELYKELMKTGGDVLPNEWTSLTNKIHQLEATSNLPFMQQDTVMKTLEALGELNHLKRNKEMWDNAYDTAKSNNSLNEIALNDNGSVYVRDRNNKISTLSLSDYEKRKGRVEALTVSELLEHRQFDPNFIHNTTVFNVANNAVSIDNISAYIQKIVGTLGTESKELTTTISREEGINKVNLLRQLSQTGRTPTEEELRGLEVLNHIADSPEEAERILRSTPGDNVEVNRKISTERNQALKAAKYIWSTLDRQSQNRLKVQSIENNVENPVEFIIDMISFGSDEFISESYTPKKAVSGAGSDSGSLSNYEHLNNPQMMLKGTLKTGQDFIFNTIDPETKEIHGLFSAVMAGSTSLTDVAGGGISETTFDNFLTRGGWGQVVDERSIYFGEQYLPSYDWEDVALLSGNDLAKVYLPSTKDNYGRIAPDINSLKKFHEVMKDYKKRKDTLTRAQVIKLFGDEGFIVNLDENDELTTIKQTGLAVRPFLITEAYTRKGADILDENVDEMGAGLRKLSGSESKATRDRLQRAYTDPTKGSKRDRGPSGVLPGWLGGKTPYKGYLYMPLREGYDAKIGAVLKQGPLNEPVLASQVSTNMRQSSNLPFTQTSISDIED